MKEKKEINLIVFEEKEVESILSTLGYTAVGGNIKQNGTVKKCDCCEIPLTTKNLGNILPGSALLYCKNTACFAEYMRTTLGI